MKPKLYLIILVVLAWASISFGQKSAPDPSKTPNSIVGGAVRSSPAYAEILLVKTELESEVEALVIDYTEEYPRVKEIRFELTLIQKEMDRLLAVKSTDTGKLTLALGKLMVRKIELETDLWTLRGKYNDEHPDVKRCKRKVEIFEAAIKEILG